MKQWIISESVCGFSFRTRPANIGGFYAEAIEGKFSSDDMIAHEPATSRCWFEFGKTPDEAIAKLKHEVFS